MAADDRHDTWGTFRELVNMTASELEDWLGTDASKRAGEHRGGGESTGHASGRAIVGILRKKKSELTDADYRHMAKVNGYIHRHLAQRPTGDVRDTRWRHSLMNWGHDPLSDTSG
ncbi:DUF3140 domain-containing protein [Streptomyces roseoviridis]|uniref:DUF3140 domain-containing protein n=1 Tax=Streptomyces roseoviridis TaxID=67361 RepID=UPI0031E831E0